MRNLNFIQGNYGKGRFGQLHQGIGRRRHQNIATVRDAVETELSERNIHRNIVLSGLVRDLLGEALEQSIELGPPSPFFLFLFEFFFVAVSVFALSIASFVKGHVGGFAVELYVFGLALADDDGVLEVDVDEHNQFTHTRLEEQVLDV